MKKRKAPPTDYVSPKNVTRSNVPLIIHVHAPLKEVPPSVSDVEIGKHVKRQKTREDRHLEVPSILQTFLGASLKDVAPLKAKTNGQTQDALEAELRRACESGNLSHELQKLRDRENFARATAPGGASEEHISASASSSPLAADAQGVVEGGYFYWKFGVEHGKAFRICQAGRAWHVIKEELEERYHLYMPRQQKRSLAYSSLLAFRYDEWKMHCCKANKRQVYMRYPPIEPLEGRVVVRPKDQLVIIRLPVKMASRLYTEVTRLTFEEEMTEEQRIDALLNFNTTASTASNRPHRPFQGAHRDSEFPGPTYRCHNCGQMGDHWKKDCTKGRRLEPKGIPKKFLRRAEKEVGETDHTYVDEQGKAVVIQWASTF